MRLPLLIAPLLALAACNETPPNDPAATPTAPATMATTNAEVEPVPGTTAASNPSPRSSETPMPGNPTPIASNADGSSCGADKAARFVGRQDTPTTRAEVIEAVGHNRIRWIGPGDVVTMDFSESRLNMSLDAKRKIIGAKCG